MGHWSALMAKVHFGVADRIYTYPAGTTKTTHEVAEILEAKYAIIENFTIDNDSAIRALFRDQAERHARAAIKGRQPTLQPTLDKLKQMFKTYIMTKQLDGRVRGVPTLASLRGVNHRLKHPYAKGNRPRPSFFDTGLYVSSFKAWIE
jgi:hypothetical protein